ncbi:MAG: hypothetical protein HFG49_07525 [Lachnospiraceae bacterium]|nr:hypothetical protein [Lachnospiraceae bacterium]
MKKNFLSLHKRRTIAVLAASAVLLSGCGKGIMAEAEGSSREIDIVVNENSTVFASSEAVPETDSKKTEEEIREEGIKRIESTDFSIREYPIDESRYDLQTDSQYKEAFRKAVTNQIPIWHPDRGEALFYQDLLSEAGKMDHETFQSEVRQSDYFYQDYDGDGFPELIVNTEGPCVLKYDPNRNQVELYRQKEPGWNLLGCGQMYYRQQGWEEDSYHYLYGYESEDSGRAIQTVMFREILQKSPADWDIQYQVSADEYQNIAVSGKQMMDLREGYWDSYENVPHPMSFFELFEKDGQGCLPGSKPSSRIWLETTQPLPVNQEEGEEWEQYKQMLEGDFSLVEDERWGSLQWNYEDALEEGNGKCNWEYFLMDFDQDGSQEMIIRFYREGVNNTASFRYKDGKVKMWGSYNSADSHGYTVPLANGKILSVNWYQDNKDWWIMRLDSHGHCIKEKMYAAGIRQEESDEPRGSEDKEGEGRRYYSFVDYYHDGYPCGAEISLSEEEWEQIESMVEGLYIPEEVWKPCSTFTPKTERPEIPGV